MTRTVNSTSKAELVKESFIAFTAVEILFDTGPFRVCNAGQNFTLTVDASPVLFYGVGNIGEISPITEGVDIQARGIKLSVSGIDTSLVSVAMNEKYQGKQVRLWNVVLDSNYQVIGAPITCFVGRLDTMSLVFGSTASISISAESRLIDLKRTKPRRWNHEDQIAVHPTDTGFQYVSQMVEKQLNWGKPA